MPTPLHTTVANIIDDGAAKLACVLSHENQSISPSSLHTVAGLVREKIISVEVNRTVCARMDSLALYLAGSESKRFFSRGDKIFLSRSPDRGNLRDTSIITHEAVHAEHDLRGKTVSRRTNEGLAYFVEAFVAARMDRNWVESTLQRWNQPYKTKTEIVNHYLIGLLAADHYKKASKRKGGWHLAPPLLRGKSHIIRNEKPWSGVIASSEFNEKVPIPNPHAAGGEANPYEALIDITKLYPDDNFLFNGIIMDRSKLQSP